MFCSRCRKCSRLEPLQRRLCGNGHVLCDNCDDHLIRCPVCGGQVNKFIRIEFINGCPSLFIFESTELPKKSERSKIPVKVPNQLKTDSEVIREHLTEYHDFQTSNNQELDDDCKSSRSSKISQNLMNERPPSNFDYPEDPEVPNFQEQGNLIKYNDVPVFEIKSRPTDTEDSVKAHSIQAQQVERSHFYAESTSKSQIEEQCYEREISYATSNQATYGRICEYVRVHLERQIGDTPCNQPDNQTYTYRTDDEFERTSEATSKSQGIKNLESNISDVKELYRNNENSLESSPTANFNSPPSSLVTQFKTPSPPKKYKLPPYTFASRVKFRPHPAPQETPCPPQSEPMYFYENGSPISLEELSDVDKSLPRGPISCPITQCKDIMVPSDYCNHISVDHSYISIRRIGPEFIGNFQVNFKGDKFEFIKCQGLFLVACKIKDLGYGEFADCLPVAVMTSKVNLKHILNVKVNDSKELRKSQNYYLFWLLGIYEYPQVFTLTMWEHDKMGLKPKLIKSLTHSIGFINQRQTIFNIFNSGNTLTISEMEMVRLTDNFKHNLNCQLTLH